MSRLARLPALLAAGLLATGLLTACQSTQEPATETGKTVTVGSTTFTTGGRLRVEGGAIR